jgi:hypothetical protein
MLTFNYSGKEYDVMEIVGKNAFFTKEGVDKPIIRKHAIFELCRYFGFYDLKYDLSFHPIDSFRRNREAVPYIVSCVITMYDPQLTRSFVGDGEASPDNLTGVAAKYPQAMAIKRARSRAVLQHLGIDAYGEDEAPDFSPSAVNIDAEMKNMLLQRLKNIAANMDPRPSRDELMKMLARCANVDVNDLTMSNITVEALVDTIFELGKKAEHHVKES